MHKLIKEGLTFDDVLLIPAKTKISPSEVDLKTKLTNTIELNAPIMSSSMETVTESRMAIAMARQGGIGVIHCNMSIEEQAIEVDKVKRSEHGVITDPFSLSPNHYVHEANKLMAKYHISGVPIAENDKLVGIITNRDLRFEIDHNKKIYEIMTKDNLITAAEGTTLDEAKKILTHHKIEKLPIVDKDFRLKGLITIKDIEKAIKYPNAAKDKHGRLIVGACVRPSYDVLERVAALVEAKVDIISVHCVHAHSEKVINTVKLIREKFPNIQILAGNVVTKEGAVQLIEAGVNAIKVGMGPGSACTTSIVTGVGVPQITAIHDCAEAAKSYGVAVVADGGIRYSGDVTKAIAAGASAVMIGGIFAACEESAGEVELFKGRKYKVYVGIASDYNSKKSSDSYELEDGLLVPEGVEGRVAYKGTVADTTHQLLGGLKEGMAYCGAKTINELMQNGTFMRVTPASLREIHPHNIHITKESPNYSIELM